MKKILLIAAAITFSISGMAQGKSQGKGKNKSKDHKTEKAKDHKHDKDADHGNENKKEKDHYDKTVWGGTSNDTDGKGPKLSKNQPAKVRAAFNRDYPNATNVVWTKYRGDWTATTGTGLLGSRTAVYHANGQRKDTRSVINRSQLPGEGTFWDRIFKRDTVRPADEVVQVERTGIAEKIFRVGSKVDNSMRYLFYNADGKQLLYDY